MESGDYDRVEHPDLERKPTPMIRALGVEISVLGYLAASGERWIQVSVGDASGWIPRLAITTDEKAAKSSLAYQGLFLPPVLWKMVLEETIKLVDYRPAPIAEHTGWADGSFAYPNGDTFVAEGRSPPIVVFAPDPTKCTRKGDLDGWINGVAAPLMDQTLPFFVLMIGFAAPLLPFTRRSLNIGFELFSDGGKGKSTLQFLLASMFGGVDSNSEEGKFWITFDATLNGLESEMAQHCDLPMIIDESNSFGSGQTRSVRAAMMTAFSFRMATGHDKKRWGGVKPKKYRVVPVISSNESLGELNRGEHGGTTRAAQSRLIPLHVKVGRPYSTFSSVPPQYKGAVEFADALLAAAFEHHGHAGPAYLQALVQARADDEEGLRARVQADLIRFRERAGVGADDGDASRVADAFGLVYAGGRLARSYGVLPPDAQCGRIALDCFTTFYAGPKPPPSFDLQLKELLKRPDVRDLDASGLRRMSDRLFAATPAFLKRNRKGQLEALVHQAALDLGIPGWKKRANASDVRVKVTKDGAHWGKYRDVRLGRRDRMVCFNLPDGYLD